ncbi:hypothetical protein LCGC14_0652420 [marine sediment metagenome]|uniref:EF-hand domain-containing protein n=1 Tax=marine sediment metagenome TaxID=412755 RepID=A0A0F9R160_9ZZZZ
MPSKSKKQARMMTAVCKSPSFRQKVGISKKVGCDFHKADKGKYHEEINTDERDRNGVNEMSDKQLDEKLRFGKAKEEISTGAAPDIGRLMKMAGIQKQLDDDRENGKLDIRGILTGVAKGDIDISEADARLQELAGITTKIAEISSKIQQDRLSLIQEIEQQLKEKETHLVEDALGDKMKGMSDTQLQKIIDDMEDEEVSGSAALQFRAARSELGRRKNTNESIELDEDSESYLAARDKAIKKAMGKDTDEDSEVDENKEEVDEGKKRDVDGDGDIDSDDYLAARDKAIKKSKGEEVDEAKDEEVDEDKEEVDESHWWNEGSNETERLRQLAGLKAEAFTETVHEEEVDEGKKRDVDGDGDIDSDDYLAAKDQAIKKSMKKEDVDTKDSPVISEEEIERKYFRELDTFKQGSLSRYMAEMIVDEMKKGKTDEEISEELSFDIDEVSYIVEFARERAAEAKTVGGKWGIERASDKEDRLIARLDKKDTGDARIAKPKPRKRDKYDALAAKHGLSDSARR